MAQGRNPRSDRVQFLGKAWIWRIAAVTWMGMIFWSSHRTWEGVGGGFPGMGNLFHAPLYGVLAFLWAGGLGAWREVPRRLPLIFRLAVSISVLWGILDEWHQSFVPGRDPDVFDVLTDFQGAILGVLVLGFIKAPREGAARRARQSIALAMGILATSLGPPFFQRYFGS
ncbi:MAG TPA: hypothetical protein ENK43_10765 [Planctomycetes bacterium]|nr:hypothetical protein [Planctomycetota bacterium]